MRAHRWAVQYVVPGDEPEEPAFGDTIGMSDHHRDGTLPRDPGYPCGPQCRPRPGSRRA